MHLMFTSNWSLAFDGIGAYADRATSNLQILWSIAVEEQFYLLFPALLLLCFRKHRFWIKLVSAAAVLGVGSRIALIWAGELFRGGKPAGYIYYSTLSYLEVFAAGALAAAVVTHAETFSRVRILFGRRWLGLALAAALTATGWLWSSYLFPPYSGTPPALFRIRDWAITVAIYPMVGLLIAAILIWINVNTHSIVSRFLRTRLMRSLGTLSFRHLHVAPTGPARDPGDGCPLCGNHAAGAPGRASTFLFVLSPFFDRCLCRSQLLHGGGPRTQMEGAVRRTYRRQQPESSPRRGPEPYLCVSRRGSGGGGVRYIAFGPTAAFRGVRCGFAARNRAAGFALGRTSWIKPAKTKDRPD